MSARLRGGEERKHHERVRRWQRHGSCRAASWHRATGRDQRNACARACARGAALFSLLAVAGRPADTKTGTQHPPTPLALHSPLRTWHRFQSNSTMSEQGIDIRVLSPQQLQSLGQSLEGDIQSLVDSMQALQQAAQRFQRSDIALSELTRQEEGAPAFEILAF